MRRRASLPFGESPCLLLAHCADTCVLNSKQQTGIQLQTQQEDSSEKKEHSILSYLMKQGTVTSDMINTAIARAPEPRISKQTANQSS